MNAPLTVTLNPVMGPGFDLLGGALAAASELDLPKTVLERLRRLGDGFRNFIVYGDAAPAAAAGEFDLPLSLHFPPGDAAFLAAIRAGDIGAVVAHDADLSVDGLATSTVGGGGIGVTPDSADGVSPLASWRFLFGVPPMTAPQSATAPGQFTAGEAFGRITPARVEAIHKLLARRAQRSANVNYFETVPDTDWSLSVRLDDGSWWHTSIPPGAHQDIRDSILVELDEEIAVIDAELAVMGCVADPRADSPTPTLAEGAGI